MVSIYITGFIFIPMGYITTISFSESSFRIFLVIVAGGRLMQPAFPVEKWRN